MANLERSESGRGGTGGSDMDDPFSDSDVRGGASSDTSGLGTGDTSGMSATAMGDSLGERGGAGDESGTGASESGMSGSNSGMSVGAGMGGFNSYDPDGPLSTSIDDIGPENPDGGSGHADASRGSTGGRGAGSQ